jgi:hypothetical protein
MKKVTITISLTKRDVFGLISIFIILLSFTGQTLFAAFSCSVATSCPTGTVIWRLASTTNAHSELPSQSNPNYNQLICCSGIVGLGNACSGSFAVVAHLSSTTNAHAEESTFSNYPENICLQVPGSDTVTVGYQNTNCLGFDTTVASLSASTNAHVGSGTAYTRKICATVSQSDLTFAVDSGTQSLTVTPGIVSATTSILSAKTTNASGFIISVQKQNSDFTLKLNTDSNVVIADKTEWIAPGATTTSGNATASSTQPNTLQFRVRVANTDSANLASSWWGSNDLNSGALFGGFPSTTQKIADRSTSAPATTTTTVLYNLNVPTTQKTGTYSGDIIYTATANP